MTTTEATTAEVATFTPSLEDLPLLIFRNGALTKTRTVSNIGHSNTDCREQSTTPATSISTPKLSTYTAATCTSLTTLGSSLDKGSGS